MMIYQKRPKRQTGFQHHHLSEFMVYRVWMISECAFFDTLGQYLSLDTDHNGMLNKEELMRWIVYGLVLFTFKIAYLKPFIDDMFYGKLIIAFYCIQ